MSGPYEDLDLNSADTDEKSAMETLGNKIMDYLLGFTPKLDVDEQEAESELEKSQKKFEEEVKKAPKVNSRDTKLHFLMGRYNS